jgi:hypothetical protein
VFALVRNNDLRSPPKEIRANAKEFVSDDAPMNIQVAVLCDAATDDNGKLNLLGAFDTIYTQQLPATHPQAEAHLCGCGRAIDYAEH